MFPLNTHGRFGAVPSLFGRLAEYDARCAGVKTPSRASGYAGVAQLARALPCQGRGREFESLRPLHVVPPGASPSAEMCCTSGSFAFGEELSLQGLRL